MEQEGLVVRGREFGADNEMGSHGSLEASETARSTQNTQYRYI